MLLQNDRKLNYAFTLFPSETTRIQFAIVGVPREFMLRAAKHAVEY